MLCWLGALCLSLEDAEDDSWAEQQLSCQRPMQHWTLMSMCHLFVCAEDEAWAERAAAEAVQRAAEDWPGSLQTAAIPLSKKARKAAHVQAAAAAAAEGPDGAGPAPTLKQAQPAGAETPKQAAVEAGTGPKRKHKGGLLDQMRARLSGGQFRALNERLYTQPGGEAFTLMQGDPGLFDLYHAVRLLSEPQMLWCGGLWHERGRCGDSGLFDQ